MRLPTEILKALPDRVVNELAILEDRALRAEDAQAHLAIELRGAHEEINAYRDQIAELTRLADGLLVRARELEESFAADRREIEAKLQHVLVTGATAR